MISEKRERKGEQRRTKKVLRCEVMERKRSKRHNNKKRRRKRRK